MKFDRTNSKALSASMRKTLDQQIADQQRWIDEHGGDIVGYVERYGSWGWW